MEDLRVMHASSSRDDWEEWTDDETAAAKGAPAMIASSTPHTTTTTTTTITAHTSGLGQPATARRSKPRQSTPKIQRLKSRKRQQFQNERLGIRLVTDMTRFRKGPQHVAQLVKPELAPVPSVEALKFADASALRALEGSPNSASVGNWAWLQNNRQSPATATPTTDGAQQPPSSASPDGNKIVIGMAMSEEDAAAGTISPQTATVATPTNQNRPPAQGLPTHQPHAASAWSPDTEDGMSPARYLQNQPGIYAQSTAPPVPAVPATYKNPAKTRLSREVHDDDDDFTPVTLFEEDGRKSPTSAGSKISPETTRSRSGWWDHVKTPFRERFSPTSKSEKEATSPDEWWKTADRKTRHMPQQDALSEASSSSARPIVPIIREPSPVMASSSRSSSSIRGADRQAHPEKPQVVMEEHADADADADVPPPYEHTPSSKQAEADRCCVVLPPGHDHLASHVPQTRQPGGEKTSYQCATYLADVPLTPAPTGTSDRDSPLPDRVAGTYVGDQFADVGGATTAAKVEKTRRRHEKEDYVARRAGGFWKGRACFPDDGCYGRSGREGRQRRRVWIVVCLAFWLLIILGVVLGVVLSRKLRDAHQATASGSSFSSPSLSPSPSRSPSSPSAPSAISPSDSDANNSDNPEKAPPSVWLNLTNFPPIPTGVATVVGADNSQAVSGCMQPASLWSCSLPPELQAANEPSEPDQPTFVFQIQYDNNTRELWNVPNGAAPTPSTAAASAAATSATSSMASTTATSATSSAASTTATNSLVGSEPTNGNAGATTELASLGFISRRDDDDATLYDTGVAPNPSPPDYDEMWFLGNWTDGIVSANKSGEPTPFYISFFPSLGDSAGPDMLTDSTPAAAKGKRQSLSQLPAPILNPDGTGAAAQLRPFPFQQPLRLYDRGLPTEHYGFYSYFNKTIYVSSLDDDDNTTNAAAADEGGVRESNAAWYATFTQTRFVVKIWTRKSAGGGSGAARLIGSSSSSSSSSNATSSPGSFPYPITVGEDTHGGNNRLKYAFAYGVEADRHVNTTQVRALQNDLSFGGSVFNAAVPNGDLSWGGTDGGTGGCKCEWVNWVEGDGTVDSTFA